MSVFKVRCKTCGDFFALKELHVNLWSDESRKQYEREVLILGTANGPALLSIHVCETLALSMSPCLYMAPEIWRGTREFDFKVDVYDHMVCVIWLCAISRGRQIRYLITNGIRPPVPDSIFPNYEALITTFWAESPKERPEFSEIVEELHWPDVLDSLNIDINAFNGYRSKFSDP